MKFRLVFLLLISCLFLQGYKYEYKIEALDASKNANNHNALGVMRMEMKQYSAAAEEFKTAILLSSDAPTSAVYYNNLGLVCMKINNFQAAEHSFNQAISLNPVFLEYYSNLISLYKLSGQLDAKLNYYSASLKKNPKNSRSCFMIALIYKENGNNEETLKYLQQFIKLEKNILLARAAKQMIYEIKMQENEDNLIK